jgi:hypothetical protein
MAFRTFFLTIEKWKKKKNLFFSFFDKKHEDEGVAPLCINLMKFYLKKKKRSMKLKVCINLQPISLIHRLSQKLKLLGNGKFNH